MSLELYAHNIRDGFSHEKIAEWVLNATLERMPDYAVFPEGYAESEPRYIDAVQTAFESSGYHVHHTLYEDDDGRPDRHGLLTIMKRTVAASAEPTKTIWLGNRNAIESKLFDPESDSDLHVVGLHLDDRSDAMRQVEIAALQTQVDRYRPTAIIGDMSSMNPYSHKPLKARLGQVAVIINKHVVALPLADPGDTSELPDIKDRVKQKLSMGLRAGEMATGKAIRALTAMGFRDADNGHYEPTYPAHKPIANLDHAMLSTGVRVTRFEVLPLVHPDRAHGPDHRPISVRVQVH